MAISRVINVSRIIADQSLKGHNAHATGGGRARFEVPTRGTRVATDFPYRGGVIGRSATPAVRLQSTDSIAATCTAFKFDERG